MGTEQLLVLFQRWLVNFDLSREPLVGEGDLEWRKIEGRVGRRGRGEGGEGRMTGEGGGAGEE